METMIQLVNPCTISLEGQTAESPLPPAQSFKEVLQKQFVAEEENKDLGPGNVAAAFLLNLLPILPDVCVGNNLDRVNLLEVQLPGHPLNQEAGMIQNQQAPFILSLPGRVENPEQNILSFTTAQTKPDPSASATSVRQDIPNILNLKEGDLQAGLLPKNIWEEGTASLLDNRADPSLGKISIQSQFPEGAVQAKGTFPKSELNPSLFLKQEETTIASFSDVINELPEGQKKPLFVTGTTFHHTPWAIRNEEIKSASSKSESNVNLSGQKITPPGFSIDSPMLLEFDEKLDILLGQNSTEKELPGRSLNGEFSGLENSSAEKKGPQVISAGENHPTQDPFGLNELLGSPKPPIVVNETGIQQKPQLSKAESLGLYQQIAEKIIWSIRNNEEKIRLTLEPPQLGSLFIELHRDKEEIKATLWADNPKTKEILENNQFQLQKTLEEHGFKLEKYEVFVQNDMRSFQGNEEKPVFHGQGSREQSLEIQEAELPQSLEVLPGAIPAAGGSQYIDRFI